MNAEFTRTRMRISTDRYQMMVATGVLTKYDRIELIEGDMLDMAPMGTKHAAITSKLHEMFRYWRCRVRPPWLAVVRSIWGIFRSRNQT